MNRRVPLVIALGLVLTGAFVVSATSTWLLGGRHHLDGVARAALILMLEVGNVTGAAIYVATRSAALRVRAGLVVGIGTAVAATGGVQAYGFLIGIPVAALLLLLVDTIAVYWHSTTGDQPSTAVDHEPVEVPREIADERDVDAPPPSETRPRIESPIDIGPATEPLPRLVDTLPADVAEPAHEVPGEPWRAHQPDEAEYAAVLLDHLTRDGRRLTERELHAALVVVCPEATRYRAKKYLGNRHARRLEATG